MIPRCVSETAEQLASENPVNVAACLIYFAAITIIVMWITRKLRF